MPALDEFATEAGISLLRPCAIPFLVSDCLVFQKASSFALRAVPFSTFDGDAVINNVATLSDAWI